MKLFNISNIHVNAASEIDALHLLHFLADSVKDWECEGKCPKNSCPFFYSITKGGNTTSICVLEAIKDLGFCELEKNTDEYGNIIEESEQNEI